MVIKLIDTCDNFKNTVNDEKEKAANEFAAKLLLPEDKLEFLIYKKGITSIEEIAKIMRVSEALVVYRLEGLGWIN